MDPFPNSPRPTLAVRGLYLQLLMAWLACGDASTKRAVLGAGNLVGATFKGLGGDSVEVRLGPNCARADLSVALNRLKSARVPDSL